MNNRFLWFLLATMLTVGCNRCKDECDDPTNPECPNYEEPVDPCASSQEVSADFRIENRVGPSPAAAYFVESDGTCCFPLPTYGTSIIRLTANQDNLNYKWIIGSDTIYNQEYAFVFGAEFCGGTYPITLIVSGQADTVCFPNDNGMDTLTRMLAVVPGFENPIWGRYKVAWNDQPSDSFEVKLNIVSTVPDDFDIYALNFANLGIQDSCPVNYNALNYKYIALTSDFGSCRRVRGTFWINQDDSFEGDYQIDNDPEPGIENISYVNKKLKGRRVQ
ncbi:MAG: hypothetical protein RLZZ262_1492 [Bacteroidota bacterium]|jgi:hypothetical protein